MSYIFCKKMNASCLKTMKHSPMVYVGKIGKISDYQKNIKPKHNSQIQFLSEQKDIEIYKYGITTNIYRRIVLEHKKKFKFFDIKLLRETFRHQEVEKIITYELQAKHLLLNMNWDNKLQKEIIFLKDDSEKKWLVNLIDYIVEQKCSQTKFVDINLF